MSRDRIEQRNLFCFDEDVWNGSSIQVDYIQELKILETIINWLFSFTVEKRNKTFERFLKDFWSLVNVIIRDSVRFCRICLKNGHFKWREIQIHTSRKNFFFNHGTFSNLLQKYGNTDMFDKSKRVSKNRFVNSKRNRQA